MRDNSRSLAAATLFLLACDAGAQNIVYTPVPAGFDFPANQQDLVDALNAKDVAKLRAHAWSVFAGLTQPARSDDPDSEAVWETWYRGEEVFTAAAAPQGIRTLKRKLEKPRQFRVPGVALPEAIGQSELAFTLFNQELKDHTRTNALYMSSTLKSLNDGWTTQTPVAARKVPDYPNKAMSLKLVWMLVRKTGTSVLPVWDSPSAPVAHAPAQPPGKWKRAVVVDPTRDTVPVGETRDAPGFPHSHVVPLKAFYHFTMDASQALQFGASAGDFAVLVAMHYTTKEIPNWVWATFWWHDKPEEGVFHEGRPDASKISGPWRNYLMDASYDMDKPQESDGKPNVVFNPWLEARFDNGVNSNCMTCHQRAVWSQPQSPPPFLPVTRGAAAENDPIFRSGTKVDFLWSLILEGDQ